MFDQHELCYLYIKLWTILYPKTTHYNVTNHKYNIGTYIFRRFVCFLLYRTFVSALDNGAKQLTIYTNIIKRNNLFVCLFLRIE